MATVGRIGRLWRSTREIILHGVSNCLPCSEDDGRLARQESTVAMCDGELGVLHLTRAGEAHELLCGFNDRK